MENLNVTHLIEVFDRNICVCVSEGKVIGNYFRAIHNSFTTHQKYIGPWVHYTNHDFIYKFTLLPTDEQYNFTEDEEREYTHFNDGLSN